MSIQIRHLNHTIKPHIGASIIGDEWRSWSRLIKDETEWDLCDFRVPMHQFEIAVKVEVTGRTIQHMGSSDVVRIKITFVGDGSPDTTTGGWMLVDWNEQRRNP